MPRTLTAWALGLLFFAGSCVPASVANQLEQQKAINEATQKTLAEVKQDLQLMQAHIENEERARWSQQLCKSAKVAEFLSELQSGIPENCAAGSNEGALLFMNSQAYAISNLWPKDGIDALHPSRMGQVRDLLDPLQQYPSTRFIILVQPEADTEPGRQRALALAEAFKGLLRSEWTTPADARSRARESFRPRELRMVGPFFLPCRLRGDVSRKYSGPMDKPLLNEPPEGKPRIRLWLFRTNC